MSTYFVSDFHLGARPREIEKETVERLCAFLEQLGDDLNHLVILGDLFDFWFEYRQLVPKGNLEVLFRLKLLVDQGVRVSYICGNHDFWIGDFMTEQLGIEVYSDELVLEQKGKKILALHGDGVAPSDWKYRILKRVLRNRVNIALFKLLPPSLAYGLAHRVSSGSREHGAVTPTEQFLKEYYEFAQARHRDGFSAVVCGHLHHPEIRQFETGAYINTGDWLTHFSAVRWDGETFEMLEAPREERQR